MASSPLDAAGDPRPVWVVSFTVAAVVDVPGVGELPRNAFLEWLWEGLADCGLQGVSEGAVSTEEAAALGLEPGPLVIDAEAAPRDRDWLGKLPELAASCWFDEEAEARQAAVRLAGVTGCGRPDVRPVSGEQPDTWRDAFEAVAIPGFGWVRPAWEPGAAGGPTCQTTLFIEPGVGFGTGLHPTTQLCLAELAASMSPAARVLDFGSGSGILAIAAALAGADQVDAVESDEQVHGAIRANAARNGVAERIQVASRLSPAAGPYDLVVANIVADVLLEHAAALAAAVRRGEAGRLAGRLVLSGLLAADLPPVIERYVDLVGSDPQIEVREGWHSLSWKPATA
jgi:ribosomal protein L11 methyltransferase